MGTGDPGFDPQGGRRGLERESTELGIGGAVEPTDVTVVGRKEGRKERPGVLRKKVKSNPGTRTNRRGVSRGHTPSGVCPPTKKGGAGAKRVTKLSAGQIPTVGESARLKKKSWGRGGHRQRERKD